VFVLSHLTLLKTHNGTFIQDGVEYKSGAVPLLPQYLSMPWYLIKHTDSFPCTLTDVYTLRFPLVFSSDTSLKPLLEYKTENPDSVIRAGKFPSS